MKKIKLTKTNKLYNQINEASPNANTNFQLDIPEQALDDLQESISRDIYNDNIFVRVKMTKNFYDAITFPTACTELMRLMEFVDFPGYLKDLGGRLNSDPKINIQKAPDYAVASFYNTVLDVFENTKVKKGTSKNESYEYYNDNELYEDIPTMTQVGQAAGELGVMVGQGIADGIGGFASTVAPAVGNAAASIAPVVGMGIAGGLGAGYATGTAIGKFSTDQNPNKFTNDKQYDIDYLNVPEEAKVKSENPIDAIDEYIKKISKITSTLLSHITAKSARQEITELEKIIYTLSGKADKTINAFIEKNNDTFKEKEDLRRQNELNNARDERELYNLRYQISTIFATHKDAIYSKELYKKIEKSRSQAELRNIYDQLMDQYGDHKNGEVFNSIQYKKTNNILNESDSDIKESDSGYVIFNADNIYDDIKTTLSEKIVKILGTDPEDWEDIKWARKEMDLMQEGADKEILAKIDIICRTTNQDNMGLGAKLGAFIRKHPMRAEYLKGLWGRYMRDLDVRKQKRIDNMTNPDGASPLAMCNNFLVNTYPSLIAMMLTYKTIIKLITDKRVKSKYSQLVADKNERNALVKEQMSQMTNILEKTFANYGHYLAKNNNNGKPIYDEKQHVFLVNGQDLTRMSYFLSNFLPGGRNILTKDTVVKYIEDLQNIVNTISPNDINSTKLFFKNFINFLNYFGNIYILKNINLLEYFNIFKEESTQQIIDILDNINAIIKQNDNNTSLFKKYVSGYTDLDISKFKYLLAYIRGTKGKFLQDYVTAKNKILKLTKDDSNAITSLRNKLHISTDNTAILDKFNDIETNVTDTDISLIFDPNINSYNLTALIYYKLGLYECSEFPNKFSGQINYELVKTFVEIIGQCFDKICLLFNTDIAKYELIHFQEEYTGTNGSVDAMGLYDLLHTFTNKGNSKNNIDYPVYAQIVDKQLKSENPIIPDGDVMKTENIMKFSDIVTLFKQNPADIKSIDTLIQKFKEDTLKDVDDIEKCANVFKAYMNQVITKFDNDFDKQDLSAFEKFVGNVDDNSPIKGEGIFVGYDSNNNAAHVSLAQFLSIYAEVVAYALKDSNVKTNLTKLTNDIDAEIKKAFKQKTGLEFNFNFVNINDGLFIQMSEKDMTPGNIKGIVDTLEVTSNGQIYKANTDMLVKNSLLNFLPDIFNLPIMTRFVNIMFGNENGKIYKYQKS